MPTEVIIDSITGTGPFNLWLCDSNVEPGNLCVYSDTIDSVDLPYNVTIPPIFISLNTLYIKIMSEDNCDIYEIINL